MVDKIRGAALAPNLVDGITSKFGEAGQGVVIGDNIVLPRRARLTLTNSLITVLGANDFGSVKLLDLPDKNLMLLGMEVDLVVTKQGNTNGIVAATDINMSVGTAAASSTTLSGAMIDVIEQVTITADALVVDFERHSNDQATATFPKKLADADALALFLNLAAVGAGVTVDTSVTVSGIIDIFYVDLGNLVSP